jgi:hypothetical protein
MELTSSCFLKAIKACIREVFGSNVWPGILVILTDFVVVFLRSSTQVPR